MEAQFNVQADALARDVRVPPQIPTLSPPWLLPAERCQLRLNNHSLHGHYLPEIRTAAQVPALYRYLAARHQWGPKTATTIDWHALNRATKTTTIPSVQLTKLVYDKLPTRHEKSKSDKTISPNCPYCAQREKFSHLLTCGNPISSQFRLDLQERLDLFLHRYHLPPLFQQAIRLSLHFWVIPEESRPPTPPQLHALYESQAAIGWHLFPKGMLSLQWRHLLDGTHSPPEASTLQKPADLISTLLQLLWETQYDMWKKYQSTQDQPSNPGGVRYQEKHDQYTQRIRFLHNNRHRCLAAHQTRYFFEDVETFLSSATLSQKKAYLHCYETVIEQSIKDASRLSNRSLLSFLGFTRKLNTTPLPQRKPAPNISHTDNFDTRHHLKATGGIPHKHSKWKQPSLSYKSIKAYFSPPTT